MQRKYIVTICLICVQSYLVFSQPYVLASDRGNMGSITAFTTVDNSCESGIKNVDLIKDSIYFIVDEILCRREKFFILIYRDDIYFSRDIQFSNIDLIRKSLGKMRMVFPDFKERVSLAKREIIRFKDSVSVVIKKNEKIKDSIAIVIRDSTLNVIRSEADSIRKSMRKLVDKLGPRKTIIENWSFYPRSEYNDDIYDVLISVFNPFRKKIKYIDFTFYGYNPVDDPALDVRYKTHIRTVKGIGPIEPLDGSTYKFESFFYSSALHSVKLKSVKIIFFDGSSSVITDPIPSNPGNTEY